MRNQELVTILTTITAQLIDWNIISVNQGDFGNGWVIGLEHWDSSCATCHQCVVVDSVSTLEEEIERIHSL